MPKTIILAAGEGIRLRPYTLDRPKCLVEVEGRSLLDRQLDVLHAEGVSPIILIGGYLADRLRRPGIALKRNPRYAKTNMVWTLFCAKEELTGEVIVAYGDIVYSRTTVRALLDSRADIAVTIDLDWEAYWRVRYEDPLADAETLKLAPDGRILEIGQKPRSLADIEGQYMGLTKFSPRGIDILKQVFYGARRSGNLCGKSVDKAYMTDMLQAIINSGSAIQAVPVSGGWVEVDTVHDLKSESTARRLRAISDET